MKSEPNNRPGVESRNTPGLLRNPLLTLIMFLGMANIFAGTEGSNTPFLIVMSVMGALILIGVVSLFWHKSKG